MTAPQRFYHLRAFRKISPCSDNELHALLARELGFKKRREIPGRRMLVALATLSVLLVVLTTMLPSGKGSADIFATPLKAMEAERAKGSEHHRRIQVAAMSNFGRKTDLAPASNKASSLLNEFAASSSMPSTGGSLPATAIPTTRTRLSPEAQVELEFWRPVARWNDLGLYEAYLRRYPSGTYSAIANAKVKTFRKGAATASASKKKPVGSAQRQERKNLWGVLTAAISGMASPCQGGEAANCRDATKTAGKEHLGREAQKKR